MLSTELLKDILQIDDFCYPESFVKVMDLNLVDFDLWYFMSEDMEIKRLNGLIERYPKRKLIPFAKRDDCDDIACFEIGQGEKVQIIHDYSMEGYEQKRTYNDFWEWLKDAINEMIEYNREEERYS